MKRWWRSTIRVRLTMLYAGAFFFASAALIVLTYAYLGQSLGHHLEAPVDGTEQLTGAELHEALQAKARQDRDDTLGEMLTWSLAALGIVGLVAAGLGWLLAGRALRPLQRITATARRVADRSLHERIALAGPDDEIKDLADTFDAMMERLDRSFDGQRRFVANASHELRTPLTINRTLIDVALDNPDTPEATRQLGTKLLAINHRHERLIDGLLVLASSDQNLTEHGPVDVAELAVHAVATSAESANSAGVEIRTTLTPAPVMGDAVLLDRLAQNLLDNAIRYNLTKDGWASISTGTANGYVYLSVENTGPIVPADEVAGLFEPFRRLASADPDRGSGLGLSIVRSVAHAHGGDVLAGSRPDGGLTVQVRIPLG